MKFTAWILLLAIMTVNAQAMSVSTFPVATTSAHEGSVSAASDGSNFLFAIQGDAGDSRAITAQLVDSVGNPIGSRISIGRSGGKPLVAFAVTNYLLAWPDDASNSSNAIYGQFISTSGTAIGTPFAISTTSGSFAVSVVDCGTTGCTVIWHDENTGALFGREVSPSGSFLGDEVYIEDPSKGTSIDSGPAIGGPTAIATDGNGNSIAVYDTGGDIRASIHGPTITKNTFRIAVKAPVVQTCADSNPVGVAFDGANYLVVWNDHSDCAEIPAWDILVQRVDPSGNLLGTPFKINSDSSPSAHFPLLTFDGTQHLVTWSDSRNDANRNGVCDAGEATCWDIYGQYVSTSGDRVGSEFVINADPGNQIGGIMRTSGDKSYGILNTGVSKNQGEFVFGDVYGLILSPQSTSPPPPDPNQNLASPPATQSEYTVPIGALPSAAVETTATGTLGSATLTIKLNLSKVLSSATSANQGRFSAGYNIYVAALVPSGVLGLTEATWFVYPSTLVWAVLGSPIAAYLEGLADNATDTVEISLLQGMDVTGLLGSEVYIGYGTSDVEMLEARRYRGVYKVQ